VQSATEEPVSGSTMEITAVDLKKRLDRGDVLTVVDVREPNEYQINRINGSILIPLGDIPRRYVELDPNDEIIMQCKVGGRSGKAADFLRSKGYKKVWNLTGGILDWIDKVDPSQPKY
jgi:rhodanese-related sulfurtransferase